MALCTTFLNVRRAGIMDYSTDVYFDTIVVYGAPARRGEERDVQS